MLAKGSTRARRAAAALLVALAGVAVAAALALAHDREFKNRVTLTKSVDAGAVAVFKGQVFSPKQKCERRREVQVYDATANPDVRLGTRRTYPNGSWKLKTPPVAAGTETYALIETKVLVSNASHDHICPVDESPKSVFPKP